MSDIGSLPDRDYYLFTTCPQSKDLDRRDYVRRVIEISQ